MDIKYMSKTKKIEDELKKIKNHFLKYFIFVMLNGNKTKICYFGRKFL